MARTNELELQVPARLPAMMDMKVKWVKIPRLLKNNHAIFAADKRKSPKPLGESVSGNPINQNDMNPVIVNGVVKVAVGTALIGAGTVLQSNGLKTLGAKVLGK